MSNEFPKWITPHPSWLVKRTVIGEPHPRVTAVGGQNVHLDRASGAITMLVNTQDEATRAAAEYIPRDPIVVEAIAKTDVELSALHDKVVAIKAQARKEADRQTAAKLRALEEAEAQRIAKARKDIASRQDQEARGLTAKHAAELRDFEADNAKAAAALAEAAGA